MATTVGFLTERQVKMVDARNPCSDSSWVAEAGFYWWETGNKAGMVGPFGSKEEAEYDSGIIRAC